MVGPRFPEQFIDELKSRVRISDVVGRKVKLVKKGKEWSGLSPFTAEKTPSFYVNDQKQFFKDFSSGKFGDVITFLQETERLSFSEAVERLAGEAGMQLPSDTPQAKAERSRKGRLMDVCEAATKFFEDQLRGPDGAESQVFAEYKTLLPILQSYSLDITSLALSDAGQWSIVTKSNITIKLGRDDVVTRLQRVLATLSQLNRDKSEHIKYIDARYPNGLAVRSL